MVAITAANGTTSGLSAVIDGTTYALTTGVTNYFRFTAPITSSQIRIKPTSGSGSYTYYVQDVLIKQRTKYDAVEVMRTDYYPFGMAMPGRTWNNNYYRYGYNGMELDNEIKGNGNSYTTEFRQYDPRLGRWLSLDPLMGQFPWMSPYVAFNNNPVVYQDPLGLKSDGWIEREGQMVWDENVHSQADIPVGGGTFPEEGYTYEAQNGQFIRLLEGEGNFVVISETDFKASKGIFDADKYYRIGNYGNYWAAVGIIALEVTPFDKVGDIMRQSRREFKAFKAMNEAVLDADGVRKEWHHIVEQHRSNVLKFGVDAIQNASNLIELERSLHREITRVFNSSAVVEGVYYSHYRDFVKTLDFNDKGEKCLK